MGKSKIEWTNVTWNPVQGCDLASPGCQHCYAMRQANRFSGPGGPYEGLTEMGPDGPRWTGVTRLAPMHTVEAPLHWREPRRIFVNSMSDLFHEDFSNDTIAAVFAVMAACPQHTFQILTKRAERLPEWFAWVDKRAEQGLSLFPEDPPQWRIRQMLRVTALRTGVTIKPQVTAGPWPLPNVHLGVSVENQKYAELRIHHLLRTPAALRWISAEPLLGEVNLRRLLDPKPAIPHAGITYDALVRKGGIALSEGLGLDWVVVGGESGNGARPFDVDWGRLLVKQCQDANVAVFVKQLGKVPLDTSGELHELVKLRSKKGGDMDEWPEDLRVRQLPEVTRG